MLFEESFRELLFVERDRLRRPAMGQLGLPQSMAADAAAWRHENTGLGLPPMLAALVPQASALSPEIRRAQRAALGAAESEGQLAEYLPSLTYLLGDARGLFEGLSSQSMGDIAEIALVARLREGTGTVKILDVAAGAGSMLLSASRAVARQGFSAEALGVELNPDTATLAAATLYLAGVPSHVAVANSLLDDPFPTQVDLAVSQPPFGLSWSRDAEGVRERHRSGWYPFGLPQQSDGSWLFASRLLEKLTTTSPGTGRAVTFMVGSSLWRPGVDAAVRAAVVDSDLIEAIIALPAGLTQAAVPCYAVVFDRNKSTARQGRIQLIDLRASSEGSQLRDAPRQIRAGALDTLRDALKSSRDGVISRTVPSDRFFKVRRQIRAAATIAEREDAPSWLLDLPRDLDLEAQLAGRYGPVEVEAGEASAPVCVLDVDSVLAGSSKPLRAWLQGTGWPVTRLSALLLAAPVAQSGPPGDGLSSASTAGTVLLPTTLTHPAALREAQSRDGDAAGRRLILRCDAQRVIPEFLVGWLNSAFGRQARERALQAASSGHVVFALRSEPRALLRFCDEIEVPVPPLAVQEAVAATEARLAASAAMVESARREAWSAPGKAAEIARRFEPLFDTSISTWLSELPYPIASAIWAFETRRQNPGAARAQILLVWEAYAAFYSAVLMSALAQDPAFRLAEMPQLRQALSDAHLSTARATMGTWAVITQRLSSRFRDRLTHGTEDERAAVLEAFGGASRGSLDALLDARIIGLITDVNHKRNAWHGHGAALTDRELSAQRDYLFGRLEELRELLGATWRELQCVRAGDGYRKDGRTFQKAELVTGPAAPFRQTELEVGELMEQGELYLCTDGARQPLLLQHFVVLRSSPNDAQYTSYFYNRREGNQVRLVAYQFADASELTEDFAGYAKAFAGLDAADDPAG